jgi:quercetin dioxygenase-like cupin family protein
MAGGSEVLEQAVIDCAPGSSLRRATGEAEEVLFVVAGRGDLDVDGERHALEPETGAYLPPGSEYALDADGPETMQVVAVRIPDSGPDGASGPTDAERSEAQSSGHRVVVRRLADQEAQAATSDRSFRIVADPSTGLRSATHFVGYIPTVRAPDHFHTYDEVIYVLEGEGTFTTADGRREIGPGSCIELPARTVHCLANEGQEEMRLVAVFRPAGSPAAAYYPDGTPAYPGTPALTSAENI